MLSLLLLVRKLKFSAQMMPYLQVADAPSDETLSSGEDLFFLQLSQQHGKTEVTCFPFWNDLLLTESLH